MSNSGSRRDWLASTAALGLSGLTFGNADRESLCAEREAVLDVGPQTQLFCDDFLIESKENARH